MQCLFSLVLTTVMYFRDYDPITYLIETEACTQRFIFSVFLLAVENVALAGRCYHPPENSFFLIHRILFDYKSSLEL